MTDIVSVIHIFHLFAIHIFAILTTSVALSSQIDSRYRWNVPTSCVNPKNHLTIHSPFPFISKKTT